MSRKCGYWLSAVLAATGIVVAVGCSNQSTPVPQGPPPVSSINPVAKSSKRTSADGGDHAHKPGAHNGLIVEIGRDNYHAEVVFEKGGKVRVYILGDDAASVQEAEAQPLNAYAKGEGDMEATPIVFRPEPLKDDKPGFTSQFLGQLPREFIGKKVEITVPSIRINNERFRFGFKNVVDEHAAGPMPPKVADDEEKKLYLTPGGKYTEADIKANGNKTASQVFKGLKAEHDLKPKSGDKICPITLTKANPKFSWVVGGKTYEFCCPPCVDEFVAAAKDPQTANEIKEPEAYRKK